MTTLLQAYGWHLVYREDLLSPNIRLQGAHNSGASLAIVRP